MAPPAALPALVVPKVKNRAKRSNSLISVTEVVVEDEELDSTSNANSEWVNYKGE